MKFNCQTARAWRKHAHVPDRTPASHKKAHDSVRKHTADCTQIGQKCKLVVVCKLELQECVAVVAREVQ